MTYWQVLTRKPFTQYQKHIYIASHETTYERDEVARAPSLETSKLSLYIFRQLHPYQRELVII